MRSSHLRRNRSGNTSPFGRPAYLVIAAILLLSITSFLLFSDDSPLNSRQVPNPPSVQAVVPPPEVPTNDTPWTLFPQPWNTKWGAGYVLAEFDCKEPPFGQGQICLDRPWTNQTAPSGTSIASIAANASVSSLDMGRKWVVVTYTGEAKQLAKVNMSAWGGWSKVIVVENREDMDSGCGPHCRVIHKKSKSVQQYKLTKILDWSHYSRKMIGFLYAVEHGAHLIYQSDDNGYINQPDSPPLEWIAPLHTTGVMMSANDGRRVVNPFAYFGQGGIFPRGYPEEEGAVIASTGTSPMGVVGQGKASSFLPIQQGVPDNGADLDATVANRSGPILFRRCQLPFAPAEWTFAPINSRHTAHYQPAFHLMYLPSSVGSSVGDIWSGYLGQRLLWDMGGVVGYIAMEAQDMKLTHLTTDSVEYKQLWEQSTTLLDFLGSWKCPYATTLDCAIFLSSQTAAAGYWSTTELPLFTAWLEDLYAVGHAPVGQLRLGGGEEGEGKREFVEGHLSNPIYVTADRMPCGTFSRHYVIIKDKFRDIDPNRLCYPGNDLPPGRTKLQSPSFVSQGEELDRERPLAAKVGVDQPPQFVYLVQGAGDESEPVMRKELCHHNAEVLMLTYEKEVPEAIFAPNANWVERRNILFSAALHLEVLRGWRWSYYIFVDEDTVVEGNWQRFEKYLNLVQPAVAEPYVNKSGCEPWTLEEQNLNDKEHTAVYDLNPQLSAYHYQAAVQLLPYSAHYGNSVFLTQALQSHKCALLYAGHCIQTKFLHLCRPQVVDNDMWKNVADVETVFKEEVNRVSGGRSGALSCFRPFKEVMERGAPFPGTVVTKKVDYDQIDFGNAEPCAAA